MIDRYALIVKLNRLCWDARSYGHDDNGLDWGVNAYGEVPGYDDNDWFHPEAVKMADELLAEFG